MSSRRLQLLNPKPCSWRPGRQGLLWSHAQDPCLHVYQPQRALQVERGQRGQRAAQGVPSHQQPRLRVQGPRRDQTLQRAQVRRWRTMHRTEGDS